MSAVETETNKPFSESRIERIKKEVKKLYALENMEDVGYFVFTSSTSNSAYNPEKGNINILFKDGTLKDIAVASDQLNVSVLSAPVTKYFLCYPKEITF